MLLAVLCQELLQAEVLLAHLHIGIPFQKIDARRQVQTQAGTYQLEVVFLELLRAYQLIMLQQ